MLLLIDFLRIELLPMSFSKVAFHFSYLFILVDILNYAFFLGSTVSPLLLIFYISLVISINLNLSLDCLYSFFIVKEDFFLL